MDRLGSVVSPQDYYSVTDPKGQFHGVPSQPRTRRHADVAEGQ